MTDSKPFSTLLRELSAAASKGPWDAEPCMSTCNESSSTNVDLTSCGHSIQRGDALLVVGSGCCSHTGVIRPEDAALIVALRNHADRLADLVERVEAYRALVGDAVLPTTTTDKGIAIYAAKSAMLAALDALCGGPKS